MKKLFSCILVLALVLGCLAGMTGLADDSGEKLSYRFLTRALTEGGGNMDYNVGNPVTEYLEEKTGVHIEFSYLPATDSATKLNTMIASGDYPDVYFPQSNVSNDLLIEWGEEGIILDLKDLIAEHMPTFSQILEERSDIRTAVTSPDGHIWSTARTDGGIHILVNNKLYVYKPWYDAYLAAGNPEVVTTEDYKAMLTYFKENDMNGNGDAADEIPLSGGDPFIQNLINPFTLVGSTHELYLKDGKVTAPYVQDEYREGLRYIHDLWENGLIDPEVFTQDGQQLKALINREAETDRIIGGFSSLWDGSYVTPSIVPYDTYVAIGPLEGPEGIKQATYSNRDVGTGYFTVFSTCEHVPELLQWLDYLYTEEGTMLMAYGLEGISWNWEDIPSIAGESKSVVRTHPGTELYELNLQWLPNAPCYRTPKIKYVESGVAGGSGIDLYVSSMQYLPFADPDTAISSNLWMDPEQSEDLKLYRADFDSYLSESKSAFITGSLSLDDDWDTFQSTLEDMGLEEYLALMQEIVEANS